MRAEGCAKVYAIADEDLEREDAQKTSSAHFVRFELTKEMAGVLKYGVALAIGVDYPEYTALLDPVPAETRASLVADLALEVGTWQTREPARHNLEESP